MTVGVKRMQQQKSKERLALAISITLTAGAFSIVPTVAEGAPVLESKSTGVVVDQATTPKVTDITSTETNNIIRWQEFSVAKGETVQFDKGQQTHNYLNLVTGANRSEIYGAIKGGQNVYVVNPHGVLFGADANVDVGNLYVSTRPVDEVEKAFQQMTKGGSPLVATAPTASTAGDVVNLGTINATSVVVEGKTVKFMDAADVAASNGAASKVTLAAQTARIGTRVAASSQADAGWNVDKVITRENFGAIKDAEDLKAVTNHLSGDYELANDITDVGSFTPIGESAPFTGKFNGNFHTVSGFTVSNQIYGGLFGQTSGATIKNLGVMSGSVSAGYAGGIAGKAQNTTFKNVYNAGVTVVENMDLLPDAEQDIGSFASGGLIGQAIGVTLDTAYNTAKKGAADDEGGTIVGILSSSTVKNVYNLSDSNGGRLFAYADTDDVSPVSNVYTSGASIVSENYLGNKNKFDTIITDATSDKTSKADYKAFGASISDSGSDSTIWRIYEGKTQPLLRAFLRRTEDLSDSKGVTLSYDYTHGSVKGSYDGKGTNENPLGLTVTYNAKDLKLDNITADDGTFSLDKVQRGGTLHDATVWNSDDSLPTASKTDHNGELYFWSAQDGYDLINDKVFILPREVDLQNALNDKSQVTKEYDGSKALSKDAIASLFEGSESSGTGIIKDDDTAHFDYSSVSGTFDTKNVGTGKVVTINGGVSLKNNDGHHNYAITSRSTSFNNTQIKGTITPHKLKVALSNTDLDKTYDGTNLVRKAITKDSFSLTGNDIKSEDDTGKKDDVSLAYVGTGSSTYGSYDAVKNTFDDTHGKDAGAHEVKLTGLRLTGSDADNYILVDAANENNVLFSTKYQADGTEGAIHNTSAQDGGALYASGTITRREILSDGTLFGWKDAAGAFHQSATREYTGNASYDDVKGKIVDAARIKTDQAAKTQTGLIEGDDVKLTAKSAVFTMSTDAAADETKNAGQAKGVRYTVDITGEDAKNYTLGGKEIAAGQTGSVIGKGSITPRTISLAANRGVDKTYDGDNKVRVDGQVPTSISPDAADSLVGYASTDAKHQLVNGDGAVLSLDGSTYEQADVRYTADRLPAAQQITYKVSVMQDGTVSSNYKINTADNANAVAITTLQDGKAVTGTIRPRTLTDLTFKDVSKTYDGKAAVRGLQATDKVQLQSVSGIQQPEGETKPTLGELIDLKSIQGTYGRKDGDTFTENPHVKDAAGSKEKKDVRYTGIQLRNAEGNYNFGTTAEGRNITETTAYGKGEIKPLEITDKDTISLEKLHNIGKTYDGTTDVANAGNYVGKLTAQIPNSSVDDRITLGYTVEKASYADKNHGTEKTVTYELKVADSANGDYTLSDMLKNSEGNFAYDGLTGDIAQRMLKGTIVNTHTTKEYDGTTEVRDREKEGAVLAAGDALVRLTAVNDDDDVGIVAADRDTVKNDSKASYRYRNVYPTGDKPQSILYQLALTNNDAGNYVFQKTQLEGEGTITPREVTPDFAPLTKIFDNTTAVFKNADKTAWTTQEKPSATLSRNLDGDALALSYDAAFADKNAGTENHVDYTHLVLSGAAAGNYQLADAVTTEQDGSRSAVGKGKINAATVKNTDIIALFDPITKIYDGSSSVAYDHTAGGYDGQEGDGKLASSHAASDYLKALSILGITLENGVDYKIEGATTYRDASGNETAHAGGATQAEYTLKLEGNALKNFTFDAELGKGFDAYTGKKDGVATYNGTAFYQNGVLTERPTASIQAKYVLAQNTNTSLLEKTYDGTKNLFSYVGGKNGAPLSQDTLRDRFTFTGILAGDSVKGAVAGEYADKNVVHTEGGIGTIDINYKLSLQNNKAGDYQLVQDTATGQALTTYTGKDQGRINPRQLDFAADKAERDFDGTADAKVEKGLFTEVLDAQGKIVADTGLVSGENLTPGTDVKAQYGGLQNGVFVADGNVNGEEDYKGIRYEGLKQALDKASGQTKTIKASNYTIADTKYFDEAKQQGKIKRLALSASDIKTRWDDVVKQYDGTTAVESPEEKFLIYIKDVHRKNNGIDEVFTLPKEIHLQYDLKNAAYNAAGAGDASSVTYDVLKLKNSDKLANNFTFTNPNDKLDLAKYQGRFTLLKNNDGTITMWKDGVQSGTSTAKVGITKRVLRVHAEHNDKIYDGNADADKSKLVLANGTDGKSAQDIQEMLKNDGVTDFKKLVEANYMATGATQETAAEANVGAKHDASQGEGGKVIKYTLDLTKKDGLTKNYALDTAKAAAADGVSVTNQVTGTETKGTYSGRGDILRRVVYVSFKDAKNHKEYDGMPTVTDTADDLIRKFDLSDEDAANKTGIIHDDTGRVRVTGATGTYDTAHVKRDASGNVLEGQHTVTYSGFTLNNTNYEVRAKAANGEDSDTLGGKGTITPAKLHVSLKDEKVTQVYDNTTDVEDLDKYGEANIQKTEGDLKIRDTVNVKLSGKPQYDNKDANVIKGKQTENRSVTYELEWDNPDYELAVAQDAPSQKLHVEQEVSATDVGKARLVTDAATITPRTVTISANPDPAKWATRLYDGKSGGAADNVIENQNLKAGNLAQGEKLINLFLKPGATKESYLPETVLRSAYDSNPNAGKDGVAIDGDGNDLRNLREHTVTYTYTLQNPNYQLDAAGTMDGTASGTGVIRRRELVLAADPQTMQEGGALPQYTGAIPKGAQTGFVPKDAASEADFLRDVIYAPSAQGAAEPDALFSPQAGRYGIYGWYRVQTKMQTIPAHEVTGADGSVVSVPETTVPVYAYYRNGNYGTNYMFHQAPANDGALRVERPEQQLPSFGDLDGLNPDRHFRPDRGSYNHATHDELGSATRAPRAGLEYAAGGVNAGAAEDAPHGEASLQGEAQLRGEAEVVNLGASGAQRVDLTTGAAGFILTGDDAVRTAPPRIEERTAPVQPEHEADVSAAVPRVSGEAPAAGAEDALLWGDSFPAAAAGSTAEAPTLFDDGAPAAEAGDLPLFDDVPGASPAPSKAAERPADDAISVTTDTTTDDGAGEDAQDSAPQREKQIAIESEGAGVNLAG